MNPRESRQRLRSACALIANCQPLPPDLRGWLVLAFNKRLRDPAVTLDKLLGLCAPGVRQLSGIEERDDAIRALAASMSGCLKARARELARLIRERDPSVNALFDFDCQPPRSMRQINRILSIDTPLSQAGEINSLWMR